MGAFTAATLTSWPGLSWPTTRFSFRPIWNHPAARGRGCQVRALGRARPDAVIQAGPVASAVHHIGVSVASRDDALAFWESFLGRKASLANEVGPAISRSRSSASPALRSTAHSSIFLAASSSSFSNIRRRTSVANPPATANPGNVHICLAVEDADAAWRRAVDCGAAPVRREGPVEIDDGPNGGARVAYLGIHDGVTLEVFQRPPAARAEAA